MRFLLPTLLLLLYPKASYGQPPTGHLTYDLISYIIYDTSKVKPKDIEVILNVVREDFKAEVYYNAKWLVVKRWKENKNEIEMYDRKKQILYTYTDLPDKQILRVDSLTILKKKDSTLLAAIDIVRATLGIVEWKQERRTILGWDTFKMVADNFPSTTPDEIWKAEFSDVPNIMYPDNLYFLNKGLPVEIIQYFDGIKFTWGVVLVEPLRKRDAIFNKPVGAYTLRIFDTEALVHEMAEYLEEDAKRKK